MVNSNTYKFQIDRSRSIHDEKYREKMDDFGSAYATLARTRGIDEIVFRDFGFHRHVPVCVKDEVAEVLKLPLDSYWTPDEIGEIVSTSHDEEIIP